MNVLLEKEYDEMLESINSANDEFVSNFFNSDKVDFYDKIQDEIEPEVVETIKGENLDAQSEIPDEPEENNEVIETKEISEDQIIDSEKTLEEDIKSSEDSSIIDDWDFPLLDNEEEIGAKEEVKEASNQEIIEENIGETQDEINDEKRKENFAEIDDLDIQSFIVSSDIINNEISRQYDNESSIIEQPIKKLDNIELPQEETKSETETLTKLSDNEIITDETEEDILLKNEKINELEEIELTLPLENETEIIKEETTDDIELEENEKNVEEEAKEVDPFISNLEKELDLDENFEFSFKNTDDILNILESSENSDDFFDRLEENNDK